MIEIVKNMPAKFENSPRKQMRLLAQASSGISWRKDLGDISPGDYDGERHTVAHSEHGFKTPIEPLL